MGERRDVKTLLFLTVLVCAGVGHAEEVPVTPLVQVSVVDSVVILSPGTDDSIEIGRPVPIRIDYKSKPETPRSLLLYKIDAGGLGSMLGTIARETEKTPLQDEFGWVAGTYRDNRTHEEKLAPPGENYMIGYTFEGMNRPPVMGGCFRLVASPLSVKPEKRPAPPALRPAFLATDVGVGIFMVQGDVLHAFSDELGWALEASDPTSGNKEYMALTRRFSGIEMQCQAIERFVLENSDPILAPAMAIAHSRMRVEWVRMVKRWQEYTERVSMRTQGAKG